MKKLSKSLVAIILIVIMLLSIVPVSVFAATNSVPTYDQVYSTGTGVQNVSQILPPEYQEVEAVYFDGGNGAAVELKNLNTSSGHVRFATVFSPGTNMTATGVILGSSTSFWYGVNSSGALVEHNTGYNTSGGKVDDAVSWGSITKGNVYTTSIWANKTRDVYYKASSTTGDSRFLMPSWEKDTAGTKKQHSSGVAGVYPSSNKIYLGGLVSSATFKGLIGKSVYDNYDSNNRIRMALIPCFKIMKSSEGGYLINTVSDSSGANVTSTGKYGKIGFYDLTNKKFYTNDSYASYKVYKLKTINKRTLKPISSVTTKKHTDEKNYSYNELGKLVPLMKSGNATATFSGSAKSDWQDGRASQLNEDCKYIKLTSTQDKKYAPNTNVIQWEDNDTKSRYTVKINEIATKNVPTDPDSANILAFKNRVGFANHYIVNNTGSMVSSNITTTDSAKAMMNHTSGADDLPMVYANADISFDLGIGREKQYIQGVFGDVNNDGEIGIDDLTDIQLYIAKMISFTDDQKHKADVNVDGKINNDDVQLMQMYIVHMKTSVNYINTPCFYFVYKDKTIEDLEDIYFDFNDIDYRQALRVTNDQGSVIDSDTDLYYKDDPSKTVPIVFPYDIPFPMNGASNATEAADEAKGLSGYTYIGANTSVDGEGTKVNNNTGWIFSDGSYNADEPDSIYVPLDTTDVKEGKINVDMVWGEGAALYLSVLATGFNVKYEVAEAIDGETGEKLQPAKLKIGDDETAAYSVNEDVLNGFKTTGADIVDVVDGWEFDYWTLEKNDDSESDLKSVNIYDPVQDKNVSYIIGEKIYDIKGKPIISLAGTEVTNQNLRFVAHFKQIAPYVNLKYTKVWDDANDRDGVRDDALVQSNPNFENGQLVVGVWRDDVHLTRYDQHIENKDGTWSTAEWKGFDIGEDFSRYDQNEFNPDGTWHEYKWEVREIQPSKDSEDEGYENKNYMLEEYYVPQEPVVLRNYIDDNNDRNIEVSQTNKHIPDIVTFTAEKVWDDFNDAIGTRPASIGVTLTRNHSGFTSGLSLNADNLWKAKGQGTASAPWYRFNNGVEYEYSCYERVGQKIGAPDGYTVTYPEKTCEVTGDVSTGKVYNYTQKIINKSDRGNIKLLKTDENGNKINNVKFELYYEQNGVDKAVLISMNKFASFGLTPTKLSTNTNGEINLTDMPVGTYHFIETQPRSGDMRYSGNITLTVTKDATASVTVKNNKVVYAQTGGIGNMIIYIIAGALVLLGVVFIVCYLIKRKKNNTIK